MDHLCISWQKAAGFEALKPEFQTYIKNVLANAKILAETLKNNGFKFTLVVLTHI